jgi:SAM-dependent methyltransferase
LGRGACSCKQNHEGYSAAEGGAKDRIQLGEDGLVGKAEFDTYKDRYRETVQTAVGFAGLNLDRYTRIKADILLDVCRHKVGNPCDLEALDVGCGVGLTDECLSSEFGALHGIDVSADCIGSAISRNPGVHYQAYQGDLFPFPDARFDVAFAICVMHHVHPSGWPQFVQEMSRVVRPGGIAVVFEHNPFNPLTRAAVNRCPFDANATLLPLRRVRNLFLDAGLVPIDSQYILFLPWRPPLWATVESWLRWLPLGAQYYVAGSTQHARGRPPRTRVNPH